MPALYTLPPLNTFAHISRGASPSTAARPSSIITDAHHLSANLSRALHSYIPNRDEVQRRASLSPTRAFGMFRRSHSFSTMSIHHVTSQHYRPTRSPQRECLSIRTSSTFRRPSLSPLPSSLFSSIKQRRRNPSSKYHRGAPPQFDALRLAQTRFECQQRSVTPLIFENLPLTRHCRIYSLDSTI